MRRREALGLTLAAVASAGAPAFAQTAAIKVGTPPFEAAGAVYFARDLGYFSKAGLNVELVPIINSSAIAEAVASGTVDIGLSAVLSIAIAHARGIPFVFVAPGNANDSAAPSAALIVPTASAIHSAKDLSGKTIGIPALKTISEYAPRNWIDKNGGDSTSVKFLELPFASMKDALDAGRIDAAWVAEPFISNNKKTTRVLSYSFDAIAKQFLISGYFSTLTWAKANPALVAKFSQAIRAAGAWANANQAASADILVKEFKLDPVTLANMTRTRYAGTMTPAAIQPQIDVASHYGLFTEFPATELLLPK
jgi:NitT/TauT family transport system substrate-binding protein